MRIRRSAKRALTILAGLCLVASYWYVTSRESPSASIEPSITKLFEQKQDNVPVEGVGSVLRLLPDDKKGLPHQRFILKLPSGTHVLIAHNIAIAPKIPELYQGAKVQFKGIYEWNSKGGVVHWTHKDSDGKHPDGWLQFQGKMYQ